MFFLSDFVKLPKPPWDFRFAHLGGFTIAKRSITVKVIALKIFLPRT